MTRQGDYPHRMSDGFPDDAVQKWFEDRTFGPSSFAAGELLEAKKDKGLRITACLPARDEGATISSICGSITSDLMDTYDLVDELLVIDSDSADDTAQRARAAGATVVHVADLVPEIPLHPGGGKGDALWRSLSAATGDIVVWLDADTVNFGPHFVTQLVGPLLRHDEVMLCKAFYERPLVAGSTTVTSGGARVTELVVRPLLALFAPELVGIVQPLAGECACRRAAMLDLPFSPATRSKRACSWIRSSASGWMRSHKPTLERASIAIATSSRWGGCRSRS